MYLSYYYLNAFIILNPRIIPFQPWPFCQHYFCSIDPCELPFLSFHLDTSPFLDPHLCNINGYPPFSFWSYLNPHQIFWLPSKDHSSHLLSCLSWESGQSQSHWGQRLFLDIPQVHRKGSSHRLRVIGSARIRVKHGVARLRVLCLETSRKSRWPKCRECRRRWTLLSRRRSWLGSTILSRWSVCQ